MARIEISSVSNPYGTGELQLQGKVAMSGTLTAVTDNLNTASPLKLSTGGVQVASTLQITTNSNPYIDAEDGAGNNRFTVGRDPSSQVVNVDFASNPTGGTNLVGAIRTYTDGVSLSNVMSFRKDGQVTSGYLGVMGSPINDALAIHLGGSQIFQVGNPLTTNQYMVIDSVAGSKRGIKFGNQGSTRQGLFLNNNDLQIAECNTTNYNPWLTIDYLSNGNVTIGAGATTSIGAKLGVRGSGSTSATTSLLVQNSSATDILKITDDGVTTMKGSASVTKIGDNNHSSILSVLNTDSTNTTFGFLFKTYSDGGYNRYIELEGSNTTGNNLNGSWVNTGGFAVLNGITNAYHSNFSIYQQYSNNVDTGIVFFNSNNLYQTRIWRDGNVSIADYTYNTSASVTSRLFVKGTGSTSGTTSLLVQNSAGSNALQVRDDLTTTLYSNLTIQAGGIQLDPNRSLAGYNIYGTSLNLIKAYGTQIYIGDSNSEDIVMVTGWSVLIGTTTRDNSSLLTLASTTRGFLPPRMTDAQVRAIVSPAVGLMAYNTDLDCPVFYSTAGWRKVSHSVM